MRHGLKLWSGNGQRLRSDGQTAKFAESVRKSFGNHGPRCRRIFRCDGCLGYARQWQIKRRNKRSRKAVIHDGKRQGGKRKKGRRGLRKADSETQSSRAVSTTLLV